MTANVKSSGWNDTTRAVLRRMWGEGAGAGVIADALCSGVFQPSRHAVIGMAHRMGLGEHPESARRRGIGPANAGKQTERARLSQEIKAQRLLARVEQERRQQEASALLRAAKTAERKLLAGRAAAEVLMPPGREERATRTVMTIEYGECRWPIGEVGDHDFGFCGAEARVGSYCARHAAAAISGNQQREAARVARLAMRGFKR